MVVTKRKSSGALAREAPGDFPSRHPLSKETQPARNRVHACYTVTFDPHTRRYAVGDYRG